MVSFSFQIHGGQLFILNPRCSAAFHFNPRWSAFHLNPWYSAAFGFKSSLGSFSFNDHPMIKAVYQFHVLKRLQVPLPHESSFNASDNPYTSSEFFKICKDYGVPDDPVKYQDEKFYWSYQHSVGWPNDYLGPDSMTQWIIEKSEGFTNVGLYRISESVRAYAYLILSSQASARSSIIENTVSALTTQKAFLNNFQEIVNCRVDIQEDIKHYQDTLSYASSKVDYSVGENIYMLPSDMNLNIRSGTVWYNNKILVSDEKFSLGKNDKVNAPAMKSHALSGTFSSKWFCNMEYV